MLNRHGTRLDIGTPEDVAELDAAEALRRQYDGAPYPNCPGGSSVPLQERDASCFERHCYPQYYSHHPQQQQQPPSQQ
ncbi:uncharacterized protein TEOVI_000390000 [Trypanosoma equiperdum]|uniref:Uncharacterized protein n=1 Tax=Trypanosoma equiperdum TaxID=5694 RepID=A0A1G4IJ18_TRYEQ|nr:hypothetical protein TEOVI_000390000 [Trypanosoma equiperdum]